MKTGKTTTARTITPWLAELVEALELDQPRVITTREVAEIAHALGIKGAPSELTRRLRERGWLLPLSADGVWEFAPGARAGRFGAGDPHIILRAALAKEPNFPGQLAYESAAWLLSLSSRQPERHVLSLPADYRPSPSIVAEYRIVRHRPNIPATAVDGLPVWAVESLLVAMASQPTSFRDWPNVLDWLPLAVAQSKAENIARELRGRPRSVITKARYLLERGTASEEFLSDAALRLPDQRPLIYFGARARPGHHVAKYNLRDSALPT